MRNAPHNIYLLGHYEEAIGVLDELIDDQGCLIARIGEVYLALPIELEERLRPHLGKKIGLIRTDIPSKEFLFRIIPTL